MLVTTVIFRLPADSSWARTVFVVPELSATTSPSWMYARAFRAASRFHSLLMISRPVKLETESRASGRQAPPRTHFTRPPCSMAFRSRRMVSTDTCSSWLSSWTLTVDCS